MIYLTNENIAPTHGDYHVRKLSQDGFCHAMQTSHEAGELKVYINDYRVVNYIQGLLGFELPDTPRFTSNRSGEFTMRLEPGDSVILFQIAPASETQQTGFAIDDDTYQVMCVQYLLYGEGAHAAALHLLHNCPFDMEFDDWVRTVYKLATDYAAATADAMATTLAEEDRPRAEVQVLPEND